jgi:hypothetical protein
MSTPPGSEPDSTKQFLSYRCRTHAGANLRRVIVVVIDAPTVFSPMHGPGKVMQTRRQTYNCAIAALVTDVNALLPAQSARAQ